MSDNIDKVVEEILGNNIDEYGGYSDGLIPALLEIINNEKIAELERFLAQHFEGNEIDHPSYDWIIINIKDRISKLKKGSE